MLTKTESLYFRDINRYKILTSEEELELVKGVQADVPGCVDKLISANLRFVVSVARRYRGRGLSYLELINEGNMGILKAAKRFDIAQNVKFISYAVWWIRQSIQRALFEQTGTVRIPPNKIGLIRKFKKALDANNQNFDATMAMEEFKDQAQEINEILDKMKSTSLDAPLSTHGSSGDDDGTKTMLDMIGDEPNQETDSARGELNRVLDGVLQNVSSREERILRMYFGLNYSHQFTLEEIGKELTLNRERVRLIRDRSLKKLFKNPASRAKLTPFLQELGE